MALSENPYLGGGRRRTVGASLKGGGPTVNSYRTREVPVRESPQQHRDGLPPPPLSRRRARTRQSPQPVGPRIVQRGGRHARQPTGCPVPADDGPWDGVGVRRHAIENVT